jgi:voltage-gated potassium channel
MPKAPRLLFPQARPDPVRSLLYRFAIAAVVIIVIAVLTWLGREGYSDADGTPVTFLDAIYYSTVTVTTTGYGDIAPLSPTARAVTAFVVTPLRVLFLVVLVSTTLAVLTERYRQARTEHRWRRTVRDHTIVAGYGTTGSAAVETLLANGLTTADKIVVIDFSREALATAQAAGLTAILADATETAAWQHANVDLARRVIVTCGRDDTATLVTLTARELNSTVPISASVREGENARLLSQSGATSVVLSATAAGRLLGLSTEAPRAVGVLEDLFVVGHGLDLIERAARPEEIGGPPRSEPGIDLPIAVVRGEARISFDDEAFQQLQAGDVVVAIARTPPRNGAASDLAGGAGGRGSAAADE